MMTPYEKFKSIKNAEIYLKEGMTFEKLDDIARTMTDNQAADHLQDQRRQLFKYIDEDCNRTYPKGALFSWGGMGFG